MSGPSNASSLARTTAAERVGRGWCRRVELVVKIKERRQAASQASDIRNGNGRIPHYLSFENDVVLIDKRSLEITIEELDRCRSAA